MDPSKRIQFLIRLGYAGERFYGVHPQPGLPTVAAALRQRLVEAAGSQPKVLVFAARTDAGVHADCNVATCWFRGPLDVQTTLARLCVPRDDGLVDVRAAQVPKHVFSRAIATGKHYRYCIEQAGSADETITQPRCAWRIDTRLDVTAMQEAADHLVGRHDFSSFRSRCRAPDPVKELFALQLERVADAPEKLLHINVYGNGFLRRMVRIIVGTLVEVGRGERSAASMPGVLQARQRNAAGRIAPPHGLTLVEVQTSWPLP